MINNRRTVHLVPHFHVDPVWWNTQGPSIDQLDASDWSGSPRMAFQRSALDVLDAHLALADSDPNYRFCVAEVDYLEPFWYHHPHRRRQLTRLMAEGRVDVVGATYNEPNSNLVSVELVRRNLIHGLRFQRGVLGASVDVSWQIDVFGHDPSLPSVLASAGIRTIVFARGPFRAWGPLLDGGFDTPAPTAHRLFPSEFEWISPDGSSVLGVYLAGHYSAGYQLDRCDDVAAAGAFVDAMADALAPLAATSDVILPIGTDIGPPSRWVTEVATGGVTPKGRRVVVSTPTEAIGAIEAAVSAGAVGWSPQTRDMNPVYTGKDVSFIDAKQAHRAIEHLLLDAEIWSTLASVTAGTPYPAAALDDAWRLLVYASHHDAVTGTESDQVYIDLVAGWRRAHHLASTERHRAIGALARTVDTESCAGTGPAIVVFCSTAGRRRDVVRVSLGPDQLGPLRWTGLRVVDESGAVVPSVAESVSRTAAGALDRVELSVLVEVDGIGHRTYVVESDDDVAHWQIAETSTRDPVEIADEGRRVTVDPQAGGCVVSWRAADGDELVPDGRLGNELALYPEYPTHPLHGEGPWHLSPSGPPTCSSDSPATVRRWISPIGERLEVCGALSTAAGPVVEHVSTLTLWRGIDRLDGEIALGSVPGSDHLVRLRWPVAVPGARPVFEVGEAVIGRGFAHVDVDAAEHPWTLDTPATNWFGSSACVQVVVDGDDATSLAIGVAEVVVDDVADRPLARELLVALVASGVTATSTVADDDRYGTLDVDSNAPDVRFVVGVAGSSALVDRMLDRLGEDDAANVAAHVSSRGAACVLLCGPLDRDDLWVPGLDVRGDRDLPVVLVVGRDRACLGGAIDDVADQLTRHVVTVVPTSMPTWVRDAAMARRTVAIVNRGTPGGAVTRDGTLHMSLLRASSGWPSGQWITPPRRTAPDGSAFQLQHWPHRFEYSLVARSGDWRDADVVRTALEVQRPLTAHVEPRHGGSTPSSDHALGFAETSVVVRSVSRAPAGTGSGGGQVVVRVSETAGRPTTASFAGSLASRFASWEVVDLLGGSDGPSGAGAVAVPLGPFQCRSVAVREGEPGGWTATAVAATGGLDGTISETGSPWPVFSRWWVQGSGPRLTSTGPVAVHLHRRRGVPDDQWSVSLARVRQHVDPAVDERPAEVDVEVTAPQGWLRGPSTHHRVLGAGEHAVIAIDLGVPDAAPSGHHVVRVTARVRVGDADTFIVHDDHVVSIGATGPVVSFVSLPSAVEVRPQRVTTVRWALRNDADTELWADVDVVSPWGTWEMLPDPRCRVRLAAGATVEVPVTLDGRLLGAIGPTELTRSPGSPSWMLARASVGALVLYSPSVPLTVAAFD